MNEKDKNKLTDKIPGHLTLLGIVISIFSIAVLVFAFNVLFR